MHPLKRPAPAPPSSYLLSTYLPPSIALVRGQGSYVWDDQGRRYLDFAMGIATNTLGHSHPYWVQKMQEQMAALSHCSNLYGHPYRESLARKLVERTGPGRVFFCNSGAEANEALVKLTRLYGHDLTGAPSKKYKILCAQNAFHGRTFGGMSATARPTVREKFIPLLDGFAFGHLNDLKSFVDLTDETTVAILLETIQGEGGIHVADPQFLRDIRTLCDEHNLLLILDEVQCGIGRTGTFYAYEKSGIQPDAIGLAKGLGGGFPIGAIWVSEKYASLFTPGSHGTTFGGSPLACVAALAVLDTLEQEDLLTKVTQNSPPWREQLQRLVNQFPHIIKEIRGEGYFIGLALNSSPAPIVQRLQQKGLLVPATPSNVIRLLPPLTVTAQVLAEAVALIETALSEILDEPLS